MEHSDNAGGIEVGADAPCPADRLKKLYIGALGLIAILTIACQVIIQRELVPHKTDPPVINIAGRQRMLSQKLAKTALAVGEILDHCNEREPPPLVRCDELDMRIHELREVLDLWARSHSGLRHGDAELGLPGTNSPEVTALFEKIEPHYQAMREAAEELLSSVEAAGSGGSDATVSRPHVAAILDHEKPFLTGMNDIVFRYGAEAQERVTGLKRTALILMSVVLLVLLLEARLVFSPGVRLIHRQFTQLRESEAWLSTTLNSIGDAVIATDAEGSVRFMNPVAQDITGWGDDEAVGKPLTDVFAIINEKTGKQAENPIKKVLREGVVLGLANHTVLISRDGTRRPIDDSGAPIKDRTGRVVGAVLIFRDVTQRRRTEEKLSKLSVAVEQSPALVIITDTRGAIEYVNPKFTELTGYTAEEVIGKNPRLLKSGEMSVDAYKQLWDTILAGKVWRGEFHNKKKNGELFWESSAIAPVRDSEGTVTSFLSVSEDITERKRVEEALRTSEAWLSTTLNSIGDAVIATDAAGSVKFLNPVAQALTGWKKDEARGKPLTEAFVIVNEQTGEQAENPVKRVLREGVVVGLANHTALISKDGTRRPIDDSGAPIRDQAGDIVGAVLVFRDISARKRTEEELDRYRHHLEQLVTERTRQLGASQEQLRQAERLASIGTLAAGIAHEINNPIGAILLAAQNGLQVKLGSDVKHEIHRPLEKIVDNAKRCGLIVKSVLQFAKQETTRKWPNDLNAILQHAAEVVRGYAEDADTVIGLQLSEELPMAVVNPIEIEQVFVNLIRNAIEAGDKGARIKILSEKTASAVRVLIQDTGRGVTDEQRKRFFDPFFTTRRDQGGMGLGLSITHGIVAEHGGTIDVQSQPGRGTTVTLTLPSEIGS